MILVETTLYKAAVIISFVANMAVPDIREEKRFTLGDRFVDRLECVEKVQHYLQAIPDQFITEYNVRIEQQSCFPIKIKYYVSPPIPRQRPLDFGTCKHTFLGCNYTGNLHKYISFQ